MKIRIKYFKENMEKLTYVDGKSDWIDLRSAENVTMKAGEFRLIPLGVAMELPKGYRDSRGRPDLSVPHHGASATDLF